MHVMRRRRRGRRGRRAAILAALERLPLGHGLLFSAPARRAGLRRCHARLRRRHFLRTQGTSSASLPSALYITISKGVNKKCPLKSIEEIYRTYDNLLGGSVSV